MYYKLSNITFCYPYKQSKNILNHYDMYLKDIKVDEKAVKKRISHLGVLKDYYEKNLTEEEADKLLCDVIMNHPYIEGAMYLKIEVYWYKASSTGVYQTVTINNENYNTQRIKEGCEQINYRKVSKVSSELEVGA